MNVTKLIAGIKIAVLAVILSLGLHYVVAETVWTAAPDNPPSHNVDAPINVGDGDAGYQRKLGALWVNTGKVMNVGLVVNGGATPLRIIDSTPGDDNKRVLTSDADGYASWKDAPSGGSSVIAKRGSCYSNSIVSTTNPLAPGRDITLAPTQTSGGLAFTCTYTPAAAGNKLLIRINGYGGTTSGSEFYGLALFKDSDVLPLGTAFISSAPVSPLGGTGTLTLVKEITTSDTSPITFKLRYGGNSNSGTYYFNSTDGNPVYGSTVWSGITIEEYTP